MKNEGQRNYGISRVITEETNDQRNIIITERTQILKQDLKNEEVNKKIIDWRIKMMGKFLSYQRRKQRKEKNMKMNENDEVYT